MVPMGNRLFLRLPRDPTLIESVRATVRRWLTGVGASDDEIYDNLASVAALCETVEACLDEVRGDVVDPR